MIMVTTSRAKMMKMANGLHTLLTLLHLCFWFCLSSDTLTTDKPISDGELLISKSQNFALGFFSPGKSTKRYVGIWYHNLPEQTVVWVANRDDPINDTSGVLSITPRGNLQLHNKNSDFPIWFTNVSVPFQDNTVIARLLDTGNLILTQKKNSEAIIWQSFDHLTDTYLPYSKIGFNRETGHSWFVQSWNTEDDPGTGSFMLNFSKSEKPEVFMYKQNLKWWRGGSFNGETFTGMPFFKHVLSTYNFTFLDKDNQVEVTYNALNKSGTVRGVVLPTGTFQVFVWDYQKNQWSQYWSAPGVQCDDYGTCGSNSKCQIVQCSCLPGFEPKSKQDWYENRDTSGGCVRQNNGRSVCGDGEGFIKVESVKIPDTSVAIANMDLSLEQCEVECLKKCSCSAYADADVRNGGSGCLAWYGDLMDVQVLTEEGHDLYIRVDAVELASYASKSKGKLTMKRTLTVSMLSIAAIALLMAFCMCCIWKRKTTEKNTTTQNLNEDSPREDEHGESTTHPNLPFFHFETILVATNDFGGENKLGQGGFGSVYKGILGNGQEIAVKRLSKCSGQGTQEFKNEIKLIARLQHRNLVRLLGYCIHKEERMLIYEYLPNKSLDFFIFGMEFVERRKDLGYCGLNTRSIFSCCSSFKVHPNWDLMCARKCPRSTIHVRSCFHVGK